MADTKYSALTDVTTPTGALEWGVNESGASKALTLTQVQSFILLKRVQSSNFTIPADFSLIQERQHTINSGVILTIGLGAIMRIL